MLRVASADADAGNRSQIAESSLRIVAYNIAHGRGLATSNWKGGDAAARLQRLDEIAELLKQLDAGVVILNEVDFDSSWSHSINQAAYLAEQAGYAFRAEQRNLDFRMLGWTYRFGNAILSRHPIAEAEVVDLPGYKTWETALAGKKRALSADIEIDGSRVRVLAAHLSHRSEDLRVQSARLLIDLAIASPHAVVVAGDLNSTPPGFPHSYNDSAGDNTLAVLDAAKLFQRLPAEAPALEQLTFHAERPRSVIDWILLPRDWKFTNYQAIDSLLSDHRPVIAEAERPLPP